MQSSRSKTSSSHGKRQRLSVRWFVVVSALAILVPAAALASGYAGTSIVLPAGEVIEDNFVRVGQTIEINGDVKGDLIVAGQSVTVNGSVAGDVIAAAQTIRLNGPVEGNVRLAASDVQVDATIGKNATIFGSTIEMTKTSQVGWSLQAFASSLDLDGIIIGHSNFYGSTAIVRGEVRGNAVFRIDEDGMLRLAPTAVIENDLTYTSTREAVVDPGATVGGTVRQVQPAPTAVEARSFFASLVSFWRLLSLFGALVVGLVILALMPKTSERIIARMTTKPVLSLGWGAIVLIVAPVLSFILLFTLIGIPLALILLALYATALYVTKVYVGLFVGMWVLRKIRKEKPVPLLWAMVLGVVLYSILIAIPFVGPLILLTGTLWALGAVVAVKREMLFAAEKGSS